MQRPIAVLLMIIATAATSLAKDKGPVGDWQAVQHDIPRGWGIEVVTSMTFPCVFESATTDELICTPVQRGGKRSDDAEIHLRRDRIREIRAEKREGSNMLASGSTGAGLGAILGALLIPGGRGVSAYSLGIGGASIGARHGRDTYILRGKVIYRRTIPDQNSPSRQAENPGGAKESHQDTKGKQPAPSISYSTVQTLL